MDKKKLNMVMTITGIVIAFIMVIDMFVIQKHRNVNAGENLLQAETTRSVEDETLTTGVAEDETKEVTSAEETQPETEKETEAATAAPTEPPTEASTEATKAVETKPQPTQAATAAPTTATTVAPTTAPPTVAPTTAPTTAPPTVAPTTVAPTTASTQAPAQRPYSVRFTKSNSYPGSGGLVTQYDVNVNNTSDREFNGWEVKAALPTGYQVVNSWNVDITVNNGVIIFRPVTYNASIGAGNSISFGVVISGPDEINLREM